MVSGLRLPHLPYPEVSRTRIKFCGLRRGEDVDAAIALGVDAVGFVLVPGSKRHVTARQAARLRQRVPAFVSVVALLMNAAESAVREAVETLGPDLLQFHGAESARECERYGLPYIKAVAMQGGADLPALARRYRHSRGLLLDGHAPGAMGGQGESFDWSQVSAIATPLILAGGLHPRNVGRAIAQLRPYAVDVSSGIESAPGIKDAVAMRAFVQAVRRADQTIERADKRAEQG